MNKLWHQEQRPDRLWVFKGQNVTQALHLFLNLTGEEMEACLFPLVGEETSGWPLARVRVLHHTQWKWSVIRRRHLLCRGGQHSFLTEAPLSNWRVALIYRCLGAITRLDNSRATGCSSQKSLSKMWTPLWPAKYHRPSLTEFLALCEPGCASGIYSWSAENPCLLQLPNKGACLVIVSTGFFLQRFSSYLLGKKLKIFP